jgi:hypothetical protein
MAIGTNSFVALAPLKHTTAIGRMPANTAGLRLLLLEIILQQTVVCIANRDTPYNEARWSSTEMTIHNNRLLISAWFSKSYS